MKWDLSPEILTYYHHLIDVADRHRALQEAYRVLVPGGLLFAAAISAHILGIARRGD